ncbi:MAG: RelA/SpoT family protein [Alphaproteobacteria bacterium]
MLRQYELVEKVKAFNPNADENLINKAYVYAMKAHGHQKRKSGDPYFHHPVEVAGILADFGCDVDTICTGLLHDTIEDTDTSYEDLVEYFGEDIAQMVEAVTKLSQYHFNTETKEEKAAENFRKLILAAASDIRVLLVKLADRVHNIRTLNFTQPEQQQRVAKETLDIYAPLAERIGINEFKSELENTSLKYIDPKTWENIEARIQFIQSRGDDDIIRIENGLVDTLSNHQIDAEIKWRFKEPYSIWKKMQTQKIRFSEIWDIVAFRIFVNTVEDCYRALWALHTSGYKFRTGRFRDFISNPKPNGYQSLHTSLIGPRKERIEVQIRTFEMHEIAEHGIAAHWRYKQNGKPQVHEYLGLRSLINIMKESLTTEEILEHTRMEMFRDQMFCFTPKGDIIQLREGALVIDFAYAVHSEVGDKCVGAIVDGIEVGPLHQLNNNEQVQILTDDTTKPKVSWIPLVKTGSARSGIRRFWRLNNREKYAEIGHGLLFQTFSQAQQNFSQEELQKAIRHFRFPAKEDLFSAIGKGELDTRAVLWFLHPELEGQTESETLDFVSNEDNYKMPINGKFKGIITFSNCCHPLPGDRIVGISMPGQTLSVHSIDCHQLAHFDNNDGPKYHWHDIAWNEESENHEYIARLKLTIKENLGSLNDVTSILTQNQINIEHIDLTLSGGDNRDVILDIHVHSLRHLNKIREQLSQSPNIMHITRPRSLST